MAVDKAEFRRALGHFASSVTVVTTKYDDGRLGGITVTAFSSVSLEPPLVEICIDKRARIHDHLQVGKAFAVNILSAEQEIVSRRFASHEVDPFHEIGYHEGVTGVPLLGGAICVIECLITECLSGGDHTIVVGEVQSTRVEEGKPLIYFRGGYAQLA